MLYGGKSRKLHLNLAKENSVIRCSDSTAENSKVPIQTLHSANRPLPRLQQLLRLHPLLACLSKERKRKERKLRQVSAILHLYCLCPSRALYQCTPLAMLCQSKHGYYATTWQNIMSDRKSLR